MAYDFLSVDFAGASKTEAWGLNENGQLVGFYVDANGVTHGFIDQQSGFTALDDPLGSNNPQFGNTVAAGINNQGQIVGYYFDSAGLAHGFMDTKNSFGTLDDPSAAKGTFAQGIAENGRVVGYYLDANGSAHGFVDDKGSFATVDVSGAAQTFARDINDPGQIAGYYLDANGKAHGFVDDKGTFTTIDDPAASGGTFVEGIAENGRLVGYYLDSSNHAHAFVYDNGTFTTVDGPSGATDTFGEAINDKGQIAGYYLDANGARHGFAAGPPIAVFDTDDKQDLGGTEQDYKGPVGRLKHQFVFSGNHSVNIAVSDDDWFLHGGPGNDALQAHGGYNVLDGGTGSNFLTGGSGTDTFFLDDRSPAADIWSTVNNFHAGDDVTVFGKFTLSDVAFSDNQGAAGFAGLTLHVERAGQPIASLTLSGYATADLTNGRLSIQFGSETDGTPFMHVIGTA